MTTPAEFVATMARTQKHLAATMAHAHRIFTDIRDGDLLPAGTTHTGQPAPTGTPSSHPEAKATQQRSRADQDAAEWHQLIDNTRRGLDRLTELAASVADTPQRHEPDQHCPHWTNGTANEEPHPCVNPDTGTRTVIPAGATRCPQCQRDPKLRVCVSCDPGLDHIPPGDRTYTSPTHGAYVNVERYDGTRRQEWIKWTLCRSCYDFERYQARRKQNPNRKAVGTG